jgi:cytochrome c biogenesis protein CcmG/thiol:disulfide interchange protein DsbE
LLILAVGVAVAAIWLLLLRPRVPRPLKVGDSVPEFSLPLAPPDGTEAPVLTGRLASDITQFIDLRSDRGRVVVLNFWATWCPPCVEEIPSLERFAEKVRPLGVEVVGVSVDQNPEALAAFIRKYHLTFPIARDPDQRLAGQYGTFKFPETYLIDRRGRLAEKIVGPLDWDDPRMLTFVRELVRPGEAKIGASARAGSSG